MQYVIIVLLVIGIFIVMFKLLSSVLKAVVTTFIITFFLIFGFVMFKSTKEPVVLFDKILIDNMGIYGLEDK